MLELLAHEHSSFITLTYAPANLPAGGTLVPRHLQNWLKYIRREYPLPLRFFAVGEYGDSTFRPHYHACMFGLPEDSGKLVEDTWAKGFITISSMAPARALYLAHYCTKKMTKVEDKRLGGRHPEYARMSRNPGIGTKGLEYVADRHFSGAGSQVIAATGDIIREYRENTRRWPLDYFMSQKLRELVGLPAKACDRVSPPPRATTLEERREAAQKETRQYYGRSGFRTL